MRSIRLLQQGLILLSFALLSACALPSGQAGSNSNGQLAPTENGIVVHNSADSAGTTSGADSSDNGVQTTGLGQASGVNGQNNWSQNDLLAKNIIYFPYDSNNLKPHGLQPLNANQPANDAAGMTPQQVLHAYANYLLQHPQAKLRIEGNTDARGSHDYNIALGERRANAVADQLEALGVKRERMTIISYGKEKPLVLGQSEDAYCQNRRAKLILQGS